MTQELSWPGTIFDVTVGIHSHEAHVLVLTARVPYARRIITLESDVPLDELPSESATFYPKYSKFNYAKKDTSSGVR